MNHTRIMSSSRPRSLARAAATAVERMEPRRLMSTYTVNTLSDAANPGAGLTTLRQAVAEANAHVGADTVAFSSSVFAPGSQHVITLTQGPIAFTDTTGATTVTGVSPKAITVSGNGAGRVFTTAAKTTVSISLMTITGGRQTAADAAGNTYGGAIYSAGTLSLDTVSVTGNAVVASGYTPGAESYDQLPGSGAGGGIYAAGPLTVTSSVLSGNTVTNSATDVNAGGGAGGGSAGGAIYGTGAVTLTNDMISGNAVAGESGNAASNDGGSGDGGAAAGGGVYAGGTLTVATSTVIGNAATGGNGDYTSDGSGGFGGGLFGAAAVTVNGSTLTGNTATGGDSGAASGTSGVAQGGGVYAGGAAQVIGTTVDGNTARGGDFDEAASLPSAGGGIYAAAAATLSADTVDGNAVIAGAQPDNNAVLAGGGGGAYVVGSLTMSSTTLSDDSVTAALAGYPVSAGRTGGTVAGGGVAVLGKSTVTGSTLDHDTATGGYGYGTANGDDGFYYRTNGGSALGGGLYARAAVTVTNSTVVDDAAVGGVGGSQDQESASSHVGNGGAAAGGGVYVTAGLTLADSTVSGNAAVGGGAGQAYQYDNSTPSYVRPNGTPGTAAAGGVDAAGGTVTLTNSVVSGDTAAGVANDVAGTLSNSSKYDLIGVGGGLKNGTNGNKVGVTNPLLSGLGANGGPTQTEVPLPGSPLIDAGSDALVPSGVTTDQRGDTREAGTVVDIGAVEYTASSATGTITGIVFNDANADGTDAAAEGGFAGFTVYADVNHDGKLDSGDVSTTTAAGGTYSLSGIPAGQYTVAVVFRSNYRSTTATTGTVGVSAGETVAGPGFGQTQAALISGTVYDDANGNGKRDAGEADLATIRVYIDANGDGQFEENETSVQTDSAGNWSFGLLAPGTYTIRVSGNEGVVTSAPAGGAFTFTVGHGSSRVGNAFAVQFT